MIESFGPREIYFAPAYASWERGAKEVQNKMIRHFIPKGSDIHDFSEKEIKNIQVSSGGRGEEMARIYLKS